MALQLRRGETRSFGKMIATSFAVMAFVLQPLVSLNIPSVFAASATVNINNVADLRAAIEGQSDGQTWNIHAGNYGLSAFNDLSVHGQTGWYFPITANNLTIRGIGNPTIYGTGYSTNGNWATQDFVSVFGNDVSIKGVTLMPKVEPNKTIEVLGANFSLTNTVIEPNTLTDQSEYNSIPSAQDRSDEKNWGGSVYFNNATGTQTLKNVTINNGGVSVHAPAATINASNVKLNYSSDVDWINDYRFYIATPSAVVNGTPKYTYHVSSTLNNIDSVLSSIGDPTTVGSDTISLDSDISLAKQATITKSVVVNGNNHVVSPTFTKTDNDNNSAIGIQSDNVTINNLTEDGANGTNLHGINVNAVKGVVLNSVTVQNNDRSGLNVNASKVTVTNLTTAHNGWDGVDVDKTGALLTVKGTSHHDETTPDIYIDTRGVGKVNDVNHQYDFVNNVKQSGDRVYTLKLAAPTTPYPGDGALINTNNFWFTWSAVQGAVSYEWQGSQSNAKDADGNLANVTWTGDYQKVQPTAPTAHSVGANGTWYWQVRAVGAYGTTSPWSAVWGVTIDTTAPAAPTNVSWKADDGTVAANDGYTNQYSGAASWTASTSSDVDHYVYKYWNDISGSAYKAGHEYSTTTSGTSISGVFNQGEGVHHFCIAAVDYAGNESSCVEFTVTYDKTKPTVQNLSLDNILVDGNTVVLSGKVNDDNLLNYQVRVQTPAHVNTTPYIGASGSVNTDGPLANLDVSALPDGDYVVRLWATDKAGNSTGNDGITTYYLPFTIDRTAPKLTITTYTVNGDGTYTVAGTTDDNNADVIVSIGLKNITAKPANGHWSVNVGAIADGTYSVLATTTDAAGNTIQISQRHTFSTPISQAEQSQGVLPKTPNGTAPAVAAQFFGAAATPAGQAVLGTTSDNGATDQAVKGASTTRNDTKSNDTKTNGFAWYWWLIAAAVAAFLWWLIAAARRHKQAE